MRFDLARLGVIFCMLTMPFFLMSASMQDKNELPIGKTAEGQKLEYQSLKSQNQRIYRVRSTAMELKTEVNWKDKDEALLKVILPKCKNPTEPCGWVTARIPSEKVKVGKTSFGYGVNGDQFVVEPDAFRRDPVEETKNFPELVSGMEGTVADREGNPVLVHVTVTSKVIEEKREKYTKLVYEFHVENSTATPLALNKEKNPKKLPVLVWQSAESAQFEKMIKGSKSSTVDSGQRVSLHVLADRYQVEHKLLKVMIGNDVIAATTAPAYRPKEMAKEKD